MSVPGGTIGERGGRRTEPQTKSFGGWQTMNVADSRLTLEDAELYVLENAMPLGKAIQSVPLYNGPAGNVLHASQIKIAEGFNLTYGANTSPHAVTIAVFEDGAAWMRDHNLDGAVDTQVAPAGTFSASPKQTAITIWQDGPILIIDETAGYFSWNGVTLTTIDATKKGPALAVFEGHAWLLTAPRTVTYTAPNTYNSFVAADGAGSFKITDDAFAGSVRHMHSTVEQLWLIGAGAVDALGNVQTAAGLTTFSITNAVNTVGSAFPNSVMGYFRSLVFFTGYSIASLLGVTPQKFSGRLDRLFASLGGVIASGPKAGIHQLFGHTVLVMLFQFTDPATAAVRSELVCFDEGRFFLCTTPDLGGNRILDLVTLTIATTPEVYGIDASGRCYRLFARAGDAVKGTATVSSKLYDLGEPVVGHQALHVGFDLTAPGSTGIAPVTVTLVSESATTGLGAVNVKFLPVANSVINRRYALHRVDAPIIGQRLGFTLQWNCADQLALEAAHVEYAPTNRWETVDLAPSVFAFTAPAGAFTWLS